MEYSKYLSGHGQNVVVGGSSTEYAPCMAVLLLYVSIHMSGTLWVSPMDIYVINRDMRL